jgi:hypothetical protein
MTQTVKAFKCQRTGLTFSTEAAARASENVLDKEKFTALRKRIAKGEYWVPEVGDYIYTRTMMSIDHGEDDVVGGLSQITRVYKSMSDGDKGCIFIEHMQHDRGGNWKQFLFKEQKELMKRHGTDFARPDPDFGPSGYDPQEWH